MGIISTGWKQKVNGIRFLTKKIIKRIMGKRARCRFETFLIKAYRRKGEIKKWLNWDLRIK